VALNADELFSPDYFAARRAFLDAALSAGARISSVEHPTAKGPGGAALFMDSALLGPDDSADALCVISATHGPEGYAGSAIQTGLLRAGAARAWAGDGLRVLMIHAHNPYGFAWDTRFNEDNIDLNRNYLADFTPPLPANDGYEAIAAWAAPRDRSPAAMAAAEAGLLGYARDNGFPALQAAISGGQFSHPDGVYFGGHGPSWSRRTLEELLRAGAQGAGRFVSVDMHTGLGPEGHGELILEHPTEDPASALARAIWVRRTATQSRPILSARWTRQSPACCRMRPSPPSHWNSAPSTP
jgi:hypothetical protein